MKPNKLEELVEETLKDFAERVQSIDVEEWEWDRGEETIQKLLAEQRQYLVKKFQKLETERRDK
jgi:hypothetical protein